MTTDQQSQIERAVRQGKKYIRRSDYGHIIGTVRKEGDGFIATRWTGGDDKQSEILTDFREAFLFTSGIIVQPSKHQSP